MNKTGILLLAACFLLSGCCQVPALKGDEGVDKSKLVVTYEAFGAVGDGKTDDVPAIYQAHEFANNENLPVKARDGATYYIGGAATVINIQTTTDFGTARFIIDDRNVENRVHNVFHVTSREIPLDLTEVNSLQVGQSNLGTTLPARSLVANLLATIKKNKKFKQLSS